MTSEHIAVYATYEGRQLYLLRADSLWPREFVPFFIFAQRVVDKLVFLTHIYICPQYCKHTDAPIHVLNAVFCVAEGHYEERERLPALIEDGRAESDLIFLRHESLNKEKLLA